MQVEVPDSHERGHVALAGTPPNANETRIGPPRNEDVRVSERYPRDVAVRQRDDGTRYVGVKADHADAIMAFFAEEYGVTYDDDGTITGTGAGDTAGGQQDGGSDTGVVQEAAGSDTPDAPADGDGDGSDTDADAAGDTDEPGTDDRPTAPADTQEAHWNAVVSAIEAGAYDDALDVVADNDSRDSVQGAVAERQEVLN